MWRTPLGDRTINGPERILLISSMQEMLEAFHLDSGLRDTEPWQFGVKKFDLLSWPQRLACVTELIPTLLGDSPPPEHTAVNESTIAALYANIVQCIEREMDNEEIATEMGSPFVHHWRTMTLAAIEQLDISPSPDEEPPRVLCEIEYEDWQLIVQVLQDFVLHDDDWEMEDIFLDQDPQQASALKDGMAITDDYFTAIPPDPSKADTKRACTTIRTLCEELPVVGQ